MSGPWEKYQQPAQAAETGPWAKYQAPAATAAPPEAPEKPGMLSNIAAGAASGFADIGDTLLNTAAYLPGKVIPAVKEWNDARTSSLDDFNNERKESTAFNVARTGGNIAATLPVGGVLGAVAKASGAAPAVVQGLTSGGLNVAGAKGAGGLALRALTGAATGGASAGLVDPQDLVTGAVVGGVAPVALKGISAAFDKTGGASVRSGATPTPAKLAAARAGAAEGFVFPPADIKPTTMTEILSGLGGKEKMGQAASARNQVVTDRLARRALGLSDDAELTADAFKLLREQAAQAYAPLREAGDIVADKALTDRLAQIMAVSKGASRSFPGMASNGVEELIAPLQRGNFDAGDAVDAISILREQADKAFRSGDSTLGRAAKQAAQAFEDQIERHLAATNPDAVNAFRAARQQIAKSYSVQKATNATTGAVSAPQLAKDLAKGRPLSGDLRMIAETSQAFPFATQALKRAPQQLSPLDMFAAGMGNAGLLFARPAARAALLSGPAQARMLADPAPTTAIGKFLSQQAAPAAVRALPVLSGGP